MILKIKYLNNIHDMKLRPRLYPNSNTKHRPSMLQTYMINKGIMLYIVYVIN